MNAVTTNPSKINNVFLYPVKLEKKEQLKHKRIHDEVGRDNKKFKFQLQNQPWLDDPQLS